MWTNLVQYLLRLIPNENWMYRLPPALFNLSLTATIVILAVLVARLFLRKAPRVYSYALWAVVAFRLICPISFSSSFSLLNAVNAPVTESGIIEYVPVDIVHTAFPSVDLLVPNINETINEQLPQGAEQLGADPLEAPASLATLVWSLGGAVLLIWALSSYLVLRHKMRTAILLKDNVFQSDQVCSPFILGFFCPKIYIPFGLDESSLGYVLAHERYHIKRLDHVVKAFSFAILVVHWFNPFCWLAFHLMSKDMEMSCDEKVLSQGNNVKTEYSTVLLSFAANRRFPSPSPLAFGETSAKSRIKNALKWKRPKVWVTILAVVLCIAVIAACAANPVSDANNDPLDGLSLSVVSVKQGTDTTSITVNLNNQSARTVYFGSMWGLECLSDSDWQDNSHAYTTEMRILKPGEIEETTLWRELPPGTYRLSKTVTLGPNTLNALNQSPEYTLSATFTITEPEADPGEAETYAAQVDAKSENETANTGVTWEYTPLLSTSYPGFPFVFRNFAYTRVEATCSVGRLIDRDTNTQGQSMTYTPKQTLYWDPWSSSSSNVPSSVIQFTIYNEDTELYSGNLLIEQTNADIYTTTYSARLSGCSELMLGSNIGGEAGAALWRFPVQNLSLDGAITLAAYRLPYYHFKTNSTEIYIDFDRSDEPIEIQLYATDAEEPLLSFSIASNHLSSCCFSNLTSSREYYLAAQCDSNTLFTIHD